MAHEEQETLHPVPAWATQNSVIELGTSEGWGTVPASVIAELQQCIHRYCWGFDERRLDILSDVFTPDGVWKASVMGEVAVGPFGGRDQILQYLSRFWRYQRDQRRHVLSNLIVEKATANEAEAYAYLQLMGSSDSESRAESVGLYRFTLRKVGPRWAIAVLSAGFDSPFWKMKVEDMSPRLKDLFGILDHQEA